MRRRPLAASLVAALAVLGLAPTAGAAPAPPDIVPLGTFPVGGSVAEILAATPNGRTLLYTNSEDGQLGFLDIADPGAPVDTGSIDVGGEPTSVALARGGRLALVAVQVEDGEDVLLVVDQSRREVVRALPLPEGPDAVSLSPDGRYAVVAIEAEESPELPGSVVVVDLRGRPEGWTSRQVGFPGLVDPEPEFVDIAGGTAAVTLQEGNAIALVDLATATVVRTFSAGTVSFATDLQDGPEVAFVEPFTGRREPDGIAWTSGGLLVTANEGDTEGTSSGGRGFSILTAEGAVVFDSLGSLEQAADAAGLYPTGRSNDRSIEVEGVAVDEVRGTELAVLASERGSFVAVYDIEDPAAPVLLELLPTGEGPEGVVVLPKRRLIVTANEEDGTVSLFAVR